VTEGQKKVYNFKKMQEQIRFFNKDEIKVDSDKKNMRIYRKQ